MTSKSLKFDLIGQSCKHFFRRCITLIEHKLFKCKNDGNCEVENVPNKCKSCRFDKCLLMGMNIQTMKGNRSKSFWEIKAKIEQRIRELANNGKYILGKMEENESFVDLQYNFEKLMVSVKYS
uniref:Nuclear receptor domain-containing protein n=1 Tax=Meloidogyne incognita TaxID=6306 RepID=A0A914NHX3_MELIC